MHLQHYPGILLVVFLLSSTASAQSESSAEAPLPAQTPIPANPSRIKQPAKSPSLEKKMLGDMKPVHALGDIYLTGQPSAEDLPLLKQAGVKTIITLRGPKEVDWDEAAGVKKNDMKFVQVPFQKPEELKPKVFDEVLKILRNKKSGPTVLHCGSANRVGAIWYAHRVLEDKLPPKDALEEAKTVGLRTPEYLKRAQAYVDEVQRREQRDKD